MRTLGLPTPPLTASLCLVLALLTPACGRKGDPVPRPLAAPAPCKAQWAAHRILELELPRLDIKGGSLVGVERVRVFYLRMGYFRPTAAQVLAGGEVILERSRPDLPPPGGSFRLDMKQIGRPAGWVVAAAVRVGEVVGAPSEPIPWLDPAI